MMKRLVHLIRDERGTSVIELALLAPILASLVIGMSDLSRAYSAKLQLELLAIPLDFMLHRELCVRWDREPQVLHLHPERLALLERVCNTP